MNPAAWEEMIAFIYPVMMTDTFVFETGDHVDDGIPTTAVEWDVL